MPTPGWRTAAITGTATVVAGQGARTAYRHLTSQAVVARTRIPRRTDKPPEADGVYAPSGGPVEPWRTGMPFDLHLMIFGDSMAAGLGCLNAEEVPGVLLARGLAEESRQRVRLSTKAICGATSKGLKGQVDAVFVAGKAPDAAVIFIGGNDVTRKHSIQRSAERLGETVDRLRRAGATVVVGTCPDLGTVGAIPQPLRSVVREWGLRLAKAQTNEVLTAGGHPVPLADLLAPEFLAAPDRMFSSDGFHPSAAGYERAVSLMLPVLASTLGVWAGGPLPDAPDRSPHVDEKRVSARLKRWLRREAAELAV